MPMTAEERLAYAETVVKQWQPLLRLQDWDIEVGLLTPSQMRGHEGSLDATWREYHATLKIRGHVLKNQPGSEAHRIEATVLHEMLHLYRYPTIIAIDGWLDRGAESKPLPWDDLRLWLREYEEQWIERVARALQTVRRIPNDQ